MIANKKVTTSTLFIYLLLRRDNPTSAMRAFHLLLWLCFFFITCYGQLVYNDVAGEWVSRSSCENRFGLSFVSQEVTLQPNGTFARLDTLFSSNECELPVAELRTSGSYQLLGLSSDITYTQVTEADFIAFNKTFRPLNDVTTAFFNAFVACWPNDTFTTGVETNILDFDCAQLGWESQASCPNGQRDQLALIDEVLFFGDPVIGAPMCELPRPKWLTTYGLVHPGGANALLLPRAATHQDEILPMLEHINMHNVRELIEDLSALPTRYFSTQTGVQASEYFERKYREASQACSSEGRATVTVFNNSAIEPGYLQSSVIGRIEGTGANAKYVVVIGGHIDSGNFFEGNQSTFVDNGTEDPRWSSYPAPGADDDLSGSGMVLEVFRTLVSLGFRPDRTLEFMAFSGEERGIYDGTIHGKTGSELIARHYRSEGRQVVAMLNFDSIGSPFNSTESDGCNPLGASDGGIGVFADPIIDASIRDLAASCVDIYSEEPYFALLGPNGNSDHMSFIGKSYPAGGMVEANIAANGLDLCGFDRQRHHTPSDTVDHVDFDYVKQFARVAMAFVIEASFAPDRAQDPNVAIDYDPTRCSSASRLSSDSVSILFSLFVAVWMW